MDVDTTYTKETMNSLKKFLTTLFCLIIMCNSFSQTIKLPSPVKTGGKPLMEALNDRKSSKENYVNADLDLQTMSNLLWAAYGFNRPDKRTVPSAGNSQEFSVYVLLNRGAYLYDAQKNTLERVGEGNFKESLANHIQPYVNDVPVHLVYVGNLDKSMFGRDGILMDVGFISQNVYLYAASTGLGTVARASFDRDKLSKILNLNSRQIIVLIQAVGHIK